MSDSNDTQNFSYLERLQFSAKYAVGFIASYIKNYRIVFLILLVIGIQGFVSYFNLPQRLNPEINIAIVNVSVSLPGASPKDVESLVTIPIENKVNSVENIDTISSSSRENFSVTTIQFASGTDPKTAEQEIQRAVDTVVLPEDAGTPSVGALDFEDQPIWTFALTASGDVPSLMAFAEVLDTEIEKLDKVDRVNKSGFEEQEIQVIIKPETARAYNLSPLLLSQLVRNSTKSFPAGNLETDKNIISLTIDPEISTIDDIRNIRINISGEVLKLGEIADIYEKSKSGQLPSFIASPNNEAERVVVFNIYKTKSADINEAAVQVEELVNEKIKSSDKLFKITTITNNAEEIRTQFTDLIGEFGKTILLVFTCLLVFVGFRQAIIAIITIPLTFLSAFIFMPIFGLSINFLTLFSFLLTLGLLVDDTIVVVSAMTTYYRTGKFTVYETGLLVWKDFIVPIWATTITTICAFVPLLLATGIIGEFLRPMPIVVGLTMISSTAIAMFIALPLMMIFLKPEFPKRVINLVRLLVVVGIGSIFYFVLPKNIVLVFVVIIYLLLIFILAKIWNNVNFTARDKAFALVKRPYSKIKYYFDHPIINMDPLADKYHSLITKILKSKKYRRQVMISIIGFALVSYALVPLGLVKNEFFPKTDYELLFVNIEFPSGTKEELMTSETLNVLESLRKTEYLEFITATVGTPSGEGVGGSGNVVGFTLHLVPEEKRISSIILAEKLRDQYKNYTSAKLTVSEINSGPPAGSDIDIQLRGDDLGILDSYADQVSAYLSERTGVNNVNKSIRAGTSKIVFIPDEDKLSKNNIGIDSISLWLRSFASGFTLDSFNFGGATDSEKDIVFKMGLDDVSTLGELSIPTSQGSYPLLSLGKLETRSSPTQINREGGKRVINVSAAVNQNQTNTTDEGLALEQFADSLNLPAGYSWKTGGVNEENAKSVQSIILAMGVAIILILVTMVVQFSSFRQAFIALLVIPLAVSSVFFLFALTGTALTFPALIGMLALFGIVVTNSMFVIDKINLNQKLGMKFLESIADAGSSRLEPIVLTKLCTVFGLLPITLSDPTWRGLGGAIIAGVLLASTIMLFFIPVVYFAFFKDENEI